LDVRNTKGEREKKRENTLFRRAGKRAPNFTVKKVSYRLKSPQQRGVSPKREKEGLVRERTTQGSVGRPRGRR